MTSRPVWRISACSGWRGAERRQSTGTHSIRHERPARSPQHHPNPGVKTSLFTGPGDDRFQAYDRGKRTSAMATNHVPTGAGAR